MRRVRFVILLPFFAIAESVLWLVAFLFNHLGFHQPAETLLRHRQLLNWLLSHGCKNVQQWGPDGYRR
jgi:hypothetical protein